MSRTIRRKNQRRWWKYSSYPEWAWKTDSGSIWRGWNPHLKEFTSWRRRCDDRVDTYRLLKDSDADVYSREKLYLGYIWNFD